MIDQTGRRLIVPVARVSFMSLLAHDSEMIEFICNENNRDPQHMIGARGESVREASPVERPSEWSKNRSQAQGRGACMMAVSA
jgi:hypothetical protein